MVAEVTMIVIDNSDVVLKRRLFKIQCDVVKLYCRAKIKSNPENTVGTVTTGEHTTHFFFRPTSDIEPFLKQIDALPLGDQNFLTSAFGHSQLGFARLPKDMKKRTLVFGGGPVSKYMKEMLQNFGRTLNERNVALDVVSFADITQVLDKTKTEVFQAFVAAAEKDHNSHFAHVPNKSSSIRDILLRSNILSPSEAATVPLLEREKRKHHEIKKKKEKDHHSQCLEKHSPRPNQEEAGSSRQHVIFPNSVQVPEKYKSQLVFGSF